MRLYDENTARNLLYYVAGVGTGLLCLLVPPQVEYREVKLTQVVTKEVERKVEVVKYKDRWRDRVTTTTKPDGTKIVVVDKTVEKEKTDAKKEESVDTKTSSEVSEVTKYLRNRYAAGVSLFPVSASVYPYVGYRLGGLPVYVTFGVGSVQYVLPYRVEFMPSVGVMVEW